MAPDTTSLDSLATQVAAARIEEALAFDDVLDRPRLLAGLAQQRLDADQAHARRSRCISR